MDLGYLALTQEPSDVMSENGNVSFVIPRNPRNTPTILGRVSTRASAIALTEDPTVIAETTAPYLAHEVVRLFQEKEHQYNTYRNASTSLNNCTLNPVNDKYIKILTHKIGMQNLLPIHC